LGLEARTAGSADPAGEKKYNNNYHYYYCLIVNYHKKKINTVDIIINMINIIICILNIIIFIIIKSINVKDRRKLKKKI